MARIEADLIVALVTGGRDYDDRDYVFETLDAANPHIVIEGGARGADRFARLWAIDRQRPYATVPAHWDTLGKKAGPMRNSWMLLLRPTVCIAFPGGSGTADMKRKALLAGVPVEEYQR